MAKTMNVPRIYCVAVARAIYELDQYSLREPQTGKDKENWSEARKLLVAILDRNEYEFPECGSKRIRK